MIILKLREAMEIYRRRNNKRITYAQLSEKTGITEGTFRQMGSRLNYQASFDSVEKICLALQVHLTELIEIVPDPPKSKSAGRKKRGG